MDSSPPARGLVEPTALYIHLAVHRRVPHAACVLHTHMPYATALSMLDAPELLMAGQNALGFHEDIAYAEYRGLALDYTEGERLAAALGDKSVLMLRNHGVLVTGALRGAGVRAPVLPGARLPGAGDRRCPQAVGSPYFPTVSCGPPPRSSGKNRVSTATVAPNCTSQLSSACSIVKMRTMRVDPASRPV